MKKNGQLPRRSFLKGLGLAAPAVVGGQSLVFGQGQAGSTSPGAASKTPARELAADLVIVGGGLGGCAAALSAARNGLRVVMTEETDWVGGQLTAQAVPPDENPWIETFGGTRSYLNLRQQIREYYLRHFPLTAEARAKPGRFDLAGRGDSARCQGAGSGPGGRGRRVGGMRGGAGGGAERFAGDNDRGDGLDRRPVDGASGAAG